MRSFSFALSALLFASLYGCKSGNSSFQKLPSGLEYRIVDDKSGDKMAAVGTVVKMHIVTTIHDSVLFDSRKLNGNEPIETPVSPVQPKNMDIMEGFPKLSEGDSVVFRAVVDSLAKGQQLPPFAKSGDLIEFRVRIVSVMTEAEAGKAKEEAAKKQQEKDDKEIAAYLQSNGLNAQKTASGMYYVITRPGSGANAANGQEVTMNYTGTLLNGKKFDSNEDPAFQHVEPFKFKLGQGQVIRGWDEGIALLNKGAKATLIIPSGMAYGAQAMPGSPANPDGIPANSSLIFNVEVKDIK